LVALLLVGNSQALVLYNDTMPPSRPPDGAMGLWCGWMSCVVINPNWIIVCNHEGGGVGSPIVINGKTYVVAAMSYSAYDLNLARITNPDGSNANLKDYADLCLDASGLVGKQVVIGGYGYTRGALTPNGAGYAWSSVGSGTLRWGTNIVTYNMYNYLYDYFEPFGSAKGTPYEAALACGDSGGGWFALNSLTGRWMVAALSDGVTTNNASMFNPADTNCAVGVPAVASWINGIIAAWAAQTYTVTANQATGGTVAVSPSSATYTSGATATVTAAPRPGYAFSGWNVTGGTISGSTLTVTGNVTLSANFAAETFTVTAATSTTWVYQNTPVATRDRHALALAVRVTNDTWGNNHYTVTVTQDDVAGVVTPTQTWTSGTVVTPTMSASWIVPANGSLGGYLVGGRVQGGGIVSSDANLAVTGNCTVTVTVVGDVSGPANPATATATIMVRQLGDIVGNGTLGVVDRTKLSLAIVQGLTDPAYDLLGDGSLGVGDRTLLSLCISGIPVN
jgi:uncharacterized repeat protein (TIGR02543 family)